MTDLDISNLPDEVADWWNNQDLTEEQKAVKNIHRYMREQTDLGPGTVIDYVKALNEILVHGKDYADVTNGRQAKQMAERYIDWKQVTENVG